jgi:hypothetical protein
VEQKAGEVSEATAKKVANAYAVTATTIKTAYKSTKDVTTSWYTSLINFFTRTKASN